MQPSGVVNMAISIDRLMTSSIRINLIALLILVSTTGAIITVSQNDDQASVSPTNSSNTNATQAPESNSDELKKLDNNSTFYYDSEAFIVDRREKSHDQEPNSTTYNRNVDKAQPTTLPPPANLSMTSGRNGRMLDLDAMLGDMEASRANKEQSVSGNRQSRYLPGVGNFDIAGGKRLHIQGFIPIVGIKDESSPTDDDGNVSGSSKQRPMVSSGAGSYNNNNNNNNDLPYAQSSIGHASFVGGVQRYLNTDPTQQQQLHTTGPVLDSLQQFNDPQVDAKYNSAAFSMVDSIKKPLKKLSNLAIGSSANDMPTPDRNGVAQQQQQNCLCVPFYMCKNGFISESSLGRSQIQQMIFQQQQQLQQQQPQHASQQPRQIDHNAVDLRRGGTVVPGPISQPKALQHQQQQAINNANFVAANSHPLIDERSFERDIITASPNDAQGSFANETLGMQVDSFLAYEQLNSMTTTGPPTTSLTSSSTSTQAPANTLMDAQLQAEPSPFPLDANSTDQSSAQANDYSQDILGRMLGLKAGHGKLPSFMDGTGGSVSQPGPAGACGLLRTCCNIPAQLLLASQQQAYSNERLMTLGGHQNINNYNNNKLSMAQQMGAGDIGPVASQKYQQSVPYGMPVQSARMQPAVNNYQPFAVDKGGPYQQQQQNSLIHRSNQYQASSQRNQLTALGARPLSPINQFQTRPPTVASPRMQHQLQGAESQVLKGWLSASEIKSLVANNQAPPPVANPQSAGPQMIRDSVGGNMNSLGTKRLLEGRCGLRQSAGITGRVQSLQYHESSADFGEYPAQAAILKRLNGSESLFVCGGTLISQFWIATAAHCIKKHSNSDLKVRLGEWDVNRDDEFYPFVEKEVRDIVVHPEFLPTNLVNDLALIRLDSPVDPSLPHVNPACLPTMEEQFTRQQCWVTGWGKDSFGQTGSFQSVLKEVELPVIGHNDCEFSLRQTRLGPHYRLHQGFICAGGEGGKDACEGDGGSGLYCVQDGLIKVAGLVSWGIGCGQAGVPGVYVNLAHYRPWIENIISIDEDVYSKNSAPVKTSTS